MKKLFRIAPDKHVSGGSGRTGVLFSWHPDGTFLATVGKNGIVHIWDRHGEKIPGGEIQLKGAGAVLAVEWDTDGERVAVLQEGNTIVEIWEYSTKQCVSLETNLKEPTFLKWAKVGHELAIGTAKGNLLLYNSQDRRKVPVLGKHPRKITCGAWSTTGKLALGSEDRTMTISDRDGNTEDQREMKHAPTEMCFAAQKGAGDGSGGETHLSINMDASLLLYNLTDPDNPLELAFQAKYGRIVTHSWFDDGHIMLGFDQGFLVVISTMIEEIGEELYSARFHHKTLLDVSYSPNLKLAACAGDSGVKILDCSKGFDDVQPEDLNLGGERASSVGWSPDGQILTVATTSGSVLAFLARMNVVHASYKSQVAYLSSLREVSVVDPRTKMAPLKVTVSLEPTFIALGGMHCAAGAQSRVHYYRCMPQDCTEVDEPTEYVGRVEEVRLNDRFAAVLAGDVSAGRGQVTLHEIEAGSNGQRRRRTFPDSVEGGGGSRSGGMQGMGASGLGATAVALTENFLLYGTRAGNVEFFLLEEWTGLSGITIRHSTGIKKLYPNASGTRVVILDDQNEAFMGNAVTCELTAFPQFPQFKVEHIMWDMAPECSGVVMVYDNNKNMHTYVYAPTTNKGATVCKLGSVEIKSNGEILQKPEAQAFKSGTPIVSHYGEVTSQDAGGNLTVTYAPQFVPPGGSGHGQQGSPGRNSQGGGGGGGGHGVGTEAMRFKFTQSLMLLQLRLAWDAALSLGGRAYWLALSYKAMEVMDVALAIRVYRQLGDAGMVMGLERLLGIEDKKLLAGHIALLYDDYTRAQELFLSSSRPVTALEMRRDLLHWDKALKLAQTLAPAQAPEISVEYARQLEFKGDYQAALKMFEEALTAMQHMDGPRSVSAGMMGGGGGGMSVVSGGGGGSTGGGGGGGGEYAAMQTVSMAGIARCTLRLGDLRRGLSYVRESGDVQLCRDCARILEGMKHVANEAAELYVLGEQYDRAAAIYIKSLKSLEKAKEIMGRVSQTKLLSEYAQRCEKEKDYEAAAEAYERARDMDSVVRLYLEELGRPEKAFDIVRKTASSTGAQLVAHYCKGEGNYRGAIEFLLMAKCSEDAFVLAKAHECMDVYTKVLGDGIAPDEAASVASYYEGQHLLGQAGHFYSLCGQYARALKLFLQCGEKEVDRAIEVVGKARNDMLTHTLIDFLMGETDGVPKEPFHIYRLYLALGNYTQAAKTAVIIARQEQDLGNYKQAHSILYETIKQLEEHKVRVPQSLRRPFTLLHSYMLVKKLVKRGDHAGAARMLLRVAVSISKFPSHKVPILTSTVIECTKAGLKASALEYAMQLMRPEYRQHVDPKFKRKIEGLVRRPKDPNPEEEFSPLSPCPISSQLIPTTSLECPTTKDAIPMCVVTGQHVVADDFTICPRSNMPAIYTEYIRYIDAESKMAADAAQAAGTPLTEAPSAMDPVTNSPITSRELIKCDAEEVAAYIAAYNMVDAPAEEGQGPETASK